jgi:uncharacterized coiled-coil DUF342 family protein
LQDQAKQLDGQRKEIARLTLTREQVEKQIADLEGKLGDKRKEFTRAVEDLATLDAQRSELARRVRDLEGQRNELSASAIKTAVPAAPAKNR